MVKIDVRCQPVLPNISLALFATSAATCQGCCVASARYVGGLLVRHFGRSIGRLTDFSEAMQAKSRVLAGATHRGRCKPAMPLAARMARQ